MASYKGCIPASSKYTVDGVGVTVGVIDGVGDDVGDGLGLIVNDGVALGVNDGVGVILGLT